MDPSVAKAAKAFGQLATRLNAGKLRDSNIKRGRTTRLAATNERNVERRPRECGEATAVRSRLLVDAVHFPPRQLNPTVDLELLPVEPIVQTLLRKPAETEVIITGRCKSRPAYFDLASVHSEMVCHKHYAERGVDLKRGVDY